MDLALHIGLPKTATTTIQRHLLAGTAGYLGKDSHGRCLSGTHEIVRELRDLATRCRFIGAEAVHARTVAWKDRVRQLAIDAQHSGTLRLSEKGLSRWYLVDTYSTKLPIHQGAFANRSDCVRAGSFPVAEFLRDHLVPNWRPYGAVRVIVTVRNQADFLASLYAQGSKKIPGAGQRQFERQVNRLIEAADPSIDWNGMINDLDAALGRENVDVLLFEDLGTAAFWRRLASFMDLGDVDASKFLHDAGPRENVKSAARPGTWKVQRSGYVRLSSFLDENWPADRLRPMRKTALAVSRSLLDTPTKPVLDPLFNRGRGKSIELTPGLREKIQSHCEVSNKRLAARLGRNLAELGY